MPRISTFYGIGIWMYWNESEHGGRPHFHARYAGNKASVSVEGELLAGSLPPRALAMARDWAALHRDELLANWARARDLQPLAPIAPLD